MLIAPKIVFVGDTGVGKTSFLIRYTSGVFPEGYVPTVFDNYSPRLWHDDRMKDEDTGLYVSPNFWDTMSGGEYDQLRPLSYEGTDIFVVCVDLSDRNTLNRVRDTWIPELKSSTPEAKGYVLLGLKQDIITIHEAEIQCLAEQTKADLYEMCSSKTGENVVAAMKRIIKLGTEHPRKQLEHHSRCHIL
eukprot:TRINITY_DN7222_c0_g1_i1.p1 TRINITY_DN7222_c0_g1~~TRINITY_DN7222_c0_g1_i1.p1  ORF type:complete len:189 (+),score=27.95 TRINITY_DN7222_c0_g1_i1:13-579(+)